MHFNAIIFFFYFREKSGKKGVSPYNYHMSIYIKTMLESAKRAAAAAQDAANDCREAAEVAKREAEDIVALGAGASTQAVDAQERVKTLEAKLTAATA